MKPASFNANKQNFIMGWYMPDEVCDLIIKEQQGTKRLYYTDPVGKESRGYKVMDLSKLGPEIHKNYIDHLDIIKNLYLDEYPILKEFQKIELEQDDGKPVINLQWYQPNKFYNVEHCENNGMSYLLYRTLVFMTYLNTIEEGGGTTFTHQKFTSKAEKGLTLIWPAYFTHTHIGVPAPNDKKYIVTGWFSFVSK